MPSTTSFNQGDVVLVPFRFTDLSAVKQRPALILSPKRLNNVRTDLIVAAISSQIPNAIGEDEILLSDADQHGWLAQSVTNQTRQNFYDSSGLDSQKAWSHARFNTGKHLAEADAIDPMKAVAEGR
jgi:hypothetical protein